MTNDTEAHSAAPPIIGCITHLTGPRKRLMHGVFQAPMPLQKSIAHPAEAPISAVGPPDQSPGVGEGGPGGVPVVPL
ncbi:predicted protein [Chaetomium globosum CBS 148.51]|uniref:Uncharacterized protein n=1 Tax=Chaetomium globosum (strain ATCC 6205 / CBS 148.51 / DSM 1962 / NBRC 6347 / NRRL 1970) TaxID=306901 RepID=Q2H8H4_CHAGB|nr:uncharacterized protein CHGG_03480 [Chaetomium globosum CBS 148.51]EAQ91545.1 predicted protein [Chaetomium globosum CBS 148.51]